ncbi:MAG: hypothetical protein L3J74_07565 [Bacteroidales bacterium]|nr:hypothetical protein [Bacteroidales bacterium]
MNNRVLRKFGFKKDQNGIINRYIREKPYWDTHLFNTKKFIIDSTRNKTKNTCVVLGSGWLLDVPIEDLSTIFNTVYLVDIVHPRQIKHKYRKIENIKFIQADISGYIKPVYDFMKIAIKKSLDITNISQKISPELNEITANASMVVSVNILNQLDILICDYIERFSVFTTEQVKVFRKIIQQKHIDLLPENKSCIITDYEEINTDDNGSVIQSRPLVYIELPLNKYVKKWVWNFDTHKTYHSKFNTDFKVMAWNK